MPRGEEEMKTSLAHRYFAALLVSIAIISMAPTLAHADQQSQPQTITLDLTGEATAFGNGLSGASTLNLTANDYKNSNQWLMIQNVTGSLHIGSAAFQITSGQGSVSKFGAVAIFAETNPGKDQLTLIGTMAGQTFTFTSPQSQLASTSYLSLSGTAAGNIGNAGGLSASADENSTSLTIGLGNETQTASAVEPQNTTGSHSENMTSTINANSTLSLTLNSSSNSTTPSSGNAPPMTGTQASAIRTVTVTQYVNQTISVTQTVANVTVSYTVTSTVAKITITQANVTTTVNTTTTNTTSPRP